MPIVRSYPISEVSPQPLPNVVPTVPAAGELALFGGDRARDLQVAGQQLGQASDSLFAIYQRHAQEANDSRVQDLTNRFLDGRREILQGYYGQTGADAIKGADAATANLKALRDETYGQTANPYQRQRLGPILDAHLAAATAGIVRHTALQQDVYARRVASDAIATSRAQAIADPAMMDNAVLRAEGAARALHAGQPPEAVEAGVRAAGGSVIAGVIGDRLTHGDPDGITLLERYGDRLDPSIRRELSAAAETLSNSLDATAWVRDRGATLPTPTGDATLDTVNVGRAATDPPPVVSLNGLLLDPDGGIVGTRQRLDEIDTRRRALIALNEQEFATNPTRLRANRMAIDSDTARNRATVKAEVDGLYADLRRHLTTGGPNGGPAVTLPPATIMSRLTEAQQDAVTAQIDANIEGRTTNTDPQTRYAIHRGLTSDTAGERQRWASTNLVPFMGRLSAEDYAALETLQSAVRRNDNGAEQRRLQLVTRMADDALRSADIDPTPRPDAPPGSDAAQAAMFHRAVQDELSAFESRGRQPTESEAYGIIQGLKDTGIKGGWLEVRDTSPRVLSDVSLEEAFHVPGAQLAQAGPTAPPEQGRRGWLTLDLDRMRREREEREQRAADEPAAAGTGGAAGAPDIEPDRASSEYEAADAQARAILAQQAAEGTGSQGGPQVEPPPGSPEHQAAEKEARRVADRQEADEREADRMTTHWLVQKTEDGSPPKLPPILAERLSPAEKEELEALAVTPDTPTDPEVYNRILRNLLNYNSGVRLKWAREPLFRYRKFLSGEDFAKLALIQSRLDPDTGQVSGFAPVPADLVSLYDWLAPEPDLEYGTILPVKHTADWKYRDWALPSSARSFLKGMLDLLAAQKTGELTTDALESFMTLHSVGGRAFSPRGDAATLVAGGKRYVPKPPSGLTAEQRRLYYFSVRHSLEWSSERTQRVLAKLDISAREFIGTYRSGSVNREFPKEFEGLTLRQAFGVDSTKLRKLLNDLRFEK